MGLAGTASRSSQPRQTSRRCERFGGAVISRWSARSTSAGTEGVGRTSMPSEIPQSTHGAIRRSRPACARLRLPTGTARAARPRPGWVRPCRRRLPQARGHLVEVDLVAQPRGEGVHRAGGVVARTVEAAVHRGLQPATGGVEHGRHRERRAGHGQRGAAGQRLQQRPQQRHHEEVESDQRGGQQPVGHRAADDPVDLVQPVPEDGDADRHRQERGQRRRPRRPTTRTVMRRPAGATRGYTTLTDGGEDKPLQLLPLDRSGPPEPRNEGDHERR